MHLLQFCPIRQPETFYFDLKIENLGINFIRLECQFAKFSEYIGFNGGSKTHKNWQNVEKTHIFSYDYNRRLRQRYRRTDYPQNIDRKIR